MADEPSIVLELRSATTTAVAAIERAATQLIAYDSSDKELAERVAMLSRLLHEMEARAKAAERLADERKGSTERVEKLAHASDKLLEALDRLPTTMKDAGIVPSSSPPEIPLYGTYDWKNVMDAKLALKQVMKGEQ